MYVTIGTMAKAKTVIAWILSLIVVGLGVFCYFKFWYVFSDGTQTGELNTISYTGYVFKTYEGEMILSGYGNKNATTSGGVQSKNFKFSVSNEEVAAKLTELTGHRVTVHFKKYLGTLPWRGYERSIVDRVIPADIEREEIPSQSPDGLFL